MQTVGMLLMNPTGRPVMTGSQLNNEANISATGFSKLLDSIIGGATGGSISGTGSAFGPQGENLVNELVDLLKRLEGLLESLNCEQAEGQGLINSGELVEVQEFKDSLLEFIKNLEELLSLVSKLGHSMNSPAMNQTPELQQVFQPLDITPQENVLDALVLMKQMIQLLKQVRSTVEAIQGGEGRPQLLQILKEITVEVKASGQEISQALKELKVVIDQMSRNNVEKDAVFDLTKEGQIKQEGQPGRYSEGATVKVAEKLEDVSAKLNLAVDKLNEVLGKINGKTIAQSEVPVGSENIESEQMSTYMLSKQGLLQNESLRTQNTVVSDRLADSFQVFRSIIEALSGKGKFVLTEQQSEFIIQLKPESLGRLQMRVIMENGLITAKFVAESQQVKEILESNMNNLRQNLADQGIKVDQLEVTLSSQKEFHSFEGRSQHLRQGRAKGQVSGAEIPEVQAERNLLNGYFFEDSTIDYTV